MFFFTTVSSYYTLNILETFWIPLCVLQNCSPLTYHRIGIWSIWNQATQAVGECMHAWSSIVWVVCVHTRSLYKRSCTCVFICLTWGIIASLPPCWHHYRFTKLERLGDPCHRSPVSPDWFPDAGLKFSQRAKRMLQRIPAQDHWYCITPLSWFGEDRVIKTSAQSHGQE